VAIAEGVRGGEVRFLGEFPATEAAMRKLIAKLAAKYNRLTFCYEAGPTGYGLYRLIKSLGHECIVVAPPLIPKKSGERVKTNRRDAVSLAKLLRAGELTAVWVPHERHEAMRDLSPPVWLQIRTSRASASRTPRCRCGWGAAIPAR
jgi:transposase